MNFDRYELHELDDTLEVDLTGDGQAEQVIFTEENDKTGLLIVDGASKAETRIGLGEPFDYLSDDFDWVDYWGLVFDAESYEVLVEDGEIVGEQIINLNHPAIFLRRSEAGGGLVVYANGQYRWVNQAG